MSNYLRFETGAELLRPFNNEHFIHHTDIIDAAESYGPVTGLYLSELAEFSGLIVEGDYNPGIKQDQRFAHAFAEGGTVALRAAEIELVNMLGDGNVEYSVVLAQFCNKPIRSVIRDAWLGLDIERHAHIKSASDQFGEHAAKIMHALDRWYCNEENPKEEDIHERRTLAATGFAFVAPLIELAVKDYVDISHSRLSPQDLDRLRDE